MTSRTLLAWAALTLVGCGFRVHVGTQDGGPPPPVDGGGPGEPCGPVTCDPGLVCCNASCGVCTEPDQGCIAIACVDECQGDRDCGPNEYCAYSGTCPPPCLDTPEGCPELPAPGVCTPRPEECPAVIHEVCGCDGTTYSSACDAQARGIDVEHEGVCEAPPPGCGPQDAAGEGACELFLGWMWDGGACVGLSGCGCVGAECGSLYGDPALCEAEHSGCAPGGPCVTDTDCGSGSYCHFAIGECAGSGDGLGDCRAIPPPAVCPFDSLPVCGCDGVTYACEADANANGASVLYDDGACSSSGPCAAQDAVGDGPCLAFLGVRWNGATCEAVGGCTCLGADCGALYPDDATCAAAHRGCELAPFGTCGGIAGGVCRPDEWCNFPSPTHVCGGDDELGSCLPRPAACDGVVAPVCGCDGVDYGNECEAQAAGVDSRAGACG